MTSGGTAEMKCASCNEDLPEDVAFCPNCGAPAPKQDAPPPAAQRAPSATRTFSGLETVVHGQSGIAHATPTLETGKVFAGRYVIDRKIGEGGMGVVYTAKDNNTSEEVVLKLIHPTLVSGEEAMKRLVAEGVTARQIRHPNIVAVYDVGQVDGQPFLTMEYVKGGTLRTWLVNAISSGQETGLNTAIGIVRAVLAGVGEAHRMGFVHRDLKPENILLGGDPAQGDFSLKILDFGIAKAVGPTRTNSGGSTGGIGTPLYMAPEQRTAPDTVGPSADLYSVTAILYELLMEAAPQGRWELPSEHRADVPKALDKVIERGLAMRARTRYQSVAEYLAALDEALGAPSSPQKAAGPAADGANKHADAAAEMVRGVLNSVRQLAPEAQKLIGDKPAVDEKSAADAAAKKKKRGMILAAVAVVVLGLGAIGNMIDTSEQPAPQPQPVKPEPQPQPPVQRQSFPVTPTPPTINAAGVWYDDAGVPFQATQNGPQIGAVGIVQGTPVRLEGTLASDGMRFQVVNATTGQPIFRGDGYVLDPSHLSYSLYALNGNLVNRGCFHLNHTPNPPCVNGRL